MSRDLIRALNDAWRPLETDADLDAVLERVGDRRVVLLGEASHGTSEFYTWRARITKRLIEEHGFHFVAVEGDWPDCWEVNRYARALPGAGPGAHDVLHAFHRWPTWMWANREVVEFAEWLRSRNDEREPESRVGFYGLDVYSLWDSMDAVLRYLEDVDAEAAERARNAYGCFDPYQEDVQEYALASRYVPQTCEEEVVGILRDLRHKAGRYLSETLRGGDADPLLARELLFDAQQNALVAKNAEAYYRTMVRGGAASWNLRDLHMVETLDRLLAHHGPESRGIVWEHNTHIGDARATDMAAGGMVNVGQLVREKYGDDDVLLVGFSSYEGTVIAGRWWGAPMEVMHVPRARRDSWEDVLHATGRGDGIVVTDALARVADASARRGHRAIGVVYQPAHEMHGNYVPTVLPDRYDVLIHIDRSSALAPLHYRADDDGEPPETFPTGM
ncbi:MAG TPA: erythromycin esterase family protein [Longimicrobiales bacterium]